MTDTPNPVPMPSLIANYTRCSSCGTEQPAPRQDQNGMWHRDFEHADGCPILTGAVSPNWDILRALGYDPTEGTRP